MRINSSEMRCYAGRGYAGPRLKMLARSEEFTAEPHPDVPDVPTRTQISGREGDQKRDRYERTERSRRGSYRTVTFRNNKYSYNRVRRDAQ
jgi:hypothetical protein